MISLNMEDLYSRIFSSAVVAIGITNLEGRYIIVNPAWSDFLGYTAEEAKKLTVSDVTPPEDIDSSKGNFAKLVNKELHSFRVKRRYLRKDGTVIWADLHVSTIMDEALNVIGVLGVFVNIDKQIQAEQELSELNSQLTQTNIDLQLAMSDLSRLARHDALTGLYNRRVLDDVLAQEIKRSTRTKRGFGVAIADLDDFKRVNDKYSHDTGDKALVELSKVLRSCIRSTDTVGRWGGEEFLLILPETSCAGAKIVLERIRTAVEEINIFHEGTKVLLSITIGLSYRHGSYDRESMIDEADKALYAGKRAGKNRVVCYQEETAGCSQ